MVSINSQALARAQAQAKAQAQAQAQAKAKLQQKAENQNKMNTYNKVGQQAAWKAEMEKTGQITVKIMPKKLDYGQTGKNRLNLNG